ncbi:hypothetical protein NDU88_000401 [Pleurodeles waltl]|uniref:Uncharacterized protein n=1 Tax=Pleurodeles waltl TaxID=8319 RepID=A0AAV7N7W3_PLEWA|nr:hypothetical protein NDU88_000401 [Pleurodeles waltl]
MDEHARESRVLCLGTRRKFKSALLHSEYAHGSSVLCLRTRKDKSPVLSSGHAPTIVSCLLTRYNESVASL